MFSVTVPDTGTPSSIRSNVPVLNVPEMSAPLIGVVPCPAKIRRACVAPGPSNCHSIRYQVPADRAAASIVVATSVVAFRIRTVPSALRPTCARPPRLSGTSRTAARSKG
jgi:hypothetical protein